MRNLKKQLEKIYRKAALKLVQMGVEVAPPHQQAQQAPPAAADQQQQQQQAAEADGAAAAPSAQQPEQQQPEQQQPEQQQPSSHAGGDVGGSRQQQLAEAAEGAAATVRARLVVAPAARGWCMGAWGAWVVHGRSAWEACGVLCSAPAHSLPPRPSSRAPPPLAVRGGAAHRGGRARPEGVRGPAALPGGQDLRGGHARGWAPRGTPPRCAGWAWLLPLAPAGARPGRASAGGAPCARPPCSRTRAGGVMRLAQAALGGPTCVCTNQPCLQRSSPTHRPAAGVVMGLAWTALGGSTLYVEAASIERGEGKGSLRTTGGCRLVRGRAGWGTVCCV